MVRLADRGERGALAVTHLDRRGTVLFLHPQGVGAGPGSADYGLTWLVGATIEDTITALRLLLSGWLVSTKAFSPDFSRLDPIKGISNMFSLTGLAELVKAIGKVILIIGVAAWVTLGQTEATMGLAAADAPRRVR